MAQKIARALEINNEFRSLEEYVTKYGTTEDILKFYGV